MMDDEGREGFRFDAHLPNAVALERIVYIFIVEERILEAWGGPNGGTPLAFYLNGQAIRRPTT